MFGVLASWLEGCASDGMAFPTPRWVHEGMHQIEFTLLHDPQVSWHLTLTWLCVHVLHKIEDEQDISVLGLANLQITVQTIHHDIMAS